MQTTTLRTVNGYAISRCVPKDIPSVIDINYKTLPEHYSDEFYYEILNSFPEGFLVARGDDRVVGYIMNRVEFGFSNLKGFSLSRKGHVVSVAVLEEDRGKGLGRALVEEGIRAIQEKGCREVFLEVRITNSVAIKLYDDLGFQTTQTLHHYYRDGEDAYLMAKSLA